MKGAYSEWQEMREHRHEMKEEEEKRRLLREGEISKEQAEKEKNKNRLQDVASVGIAALGMKGAYSEWQEMREHRHEMKEEEEKRSRHRAKREARRRKSMIAAQQYRNSGYAGSMPNLVTPAYTGYGGPHSAGPVTTYYDGNPYGAVSQQQMPGPFPPPPMGMPPQTRSDVH